VDVTEIGHFGCPSELLRSDLIERRKNRCHGVVDPDINRPELFLDNLCCGVELPGICYIADDHQSTPSGKFDFRFRCFKPMPVTRD
jgi:hypothetical protein